MQSAIGAERTAERSADLSPLGTAVAGVVMLAFSGAMFYLLTCLWPVRTGPAGADWDKTLSMFGKQFELASEVRFLLVVAVSAALGSYVHAATSFASYVGNKTLSRSWLWWYALRPTIGVALALIFYFVIRGGLLTTTSTGDISPFGATALGGLVGMFSKQATDKLRETFDNLFRTAPGKGDDARDNKLEESQPIAP